MSLALLFALSALSLASASQLSISATPSPTGCVAPYTGQGGINCIGVAELNAQQCASFATYEGQPLQYVEIPPQGSTTSYCVVAYGSTCPQSITILQQEGFATFTYCSAADAQTVDQWVTEAISKGDIKVSGSTTPSSPSTACTTDACLAEQSCSDCTTSCQAIEISMQSCGCGELPSNCASGCQCCSTGNFEDCSE